MIILQKGRCVVVEIDNGVQLCRLASISEHHGIAYLRFVPEGRDQDSERPSAPNVDADRFELVMA